MWISQERKYLFQWNKKHFFIIFEGLSFGEKKKWQTQALNSFCYIVLLFVWAQAVCLRFLKSYIFQTGDINIFVVHGDFFSRYV